MIQLLESLPAYMHHEDEDNRLYLMISRDIRGHWNMCYETEGRCYYTATAKQLDGQYGCVELLKALLAGGHDTVTDLELRDPEATDD